MPSGAATLFPVLETRGIPREGGPIGVMLHRHTIARGLVAKTGEELDGTDADSTEAPRRFRETARAYLGLLRQHIFKEDNVLFEAGDQVMTDDNQRQLTESFCETGCRAFDGKRREELEALADAIEARTQVTS